MNAPLLEIDSVVKAYGRIEALKGISLAMAAGSITCLLGPNGAGKTTLMMTIAGLLRPSRGTIRFAGRELAGQPAHRVVACGISLVAESGLVFANMSVRDNLRLGAYGRRDAAEIDADMARMYARFPRLEERRDQNAGTLSGGEQKMLAVARALMARPKLLLMDELSIGLAPLVVEDMFRLVRDINAEGTSILLVEQNVRMALTVAHRFHFIEQGRVSFSGEPGEFAEEEAIHCACFGRTEREALDSAANGN